MHTITSADSDNVQSADRTMGSNEGPPPAPSGDDPVSPGGSEESLFDGVSVGGKLYATSPIETSFQQVFHFLALYGWYVVLCVVVAAIVWVKVGPSLRSWWKRREEKWEEVNFDPVKAEKYQDSMMQAREKMQRELDEKALEHKQQMEEQENTERDERIRQWETFQVVSKSKTSSRPKSDGQPKPPSRRDNFFPLSGGMGGRGYRPARRNVGGG